METMKYNILCHVEGGITGSRTSLMKGLNGNIIEFDNHDEAIAIVSKCNKEMINPLSRARLSYSVIESL